MLKMSTHPILKFKSFSIHFIIIFSVWHSLASIGPHIISISNMFFNESLIDNILAGSI